MNDPVMIYGGLGAALAMIGWLGWRAPSLLLALALLSLAVRPQLFYGGAAIDFAWGWHQSLLLVALVANAVHFGVRATMNWPLLALLVAGLLSAAFGDLHPDLTYGQLAGTVAVLMMPWCFTQVILEPGSRRLLATAIALGPALSVALLVAAELAGVPKPARHPFRLEGLTGNPEPFAILAFAGFAVALHESTRPGRALAPVLAVVNLVFVIVSGTRMAIFASLLILVTYAALSIDFRQLVWRHRIAGALALLCVSAAFVAYWPTLESRLFERGAGDFAWTADPAGAVALSERSDIWQVYLREWQKSPWFGRGPGSGFIAAGQQMRLGQVRPHNEYVHLLSSSGAIGSALLVIAIALWYRHLLSAASAHDRAFLIAIVPALGALAITEDVLIFSTALGLYAYFGVLLTRGSRLSTGAPMTDESAQHAAIPDEAAARIRAWARRRGSPEDSPD